MGSSSEEDLRAERAAVLARSAVGAEPGSPARPHPVDRLDRRGSYYLVFLEGAVAAVDPTEEEVLSWAQAAEPTIEVEPGQARELVGAPADAPTRLVWQASLASRSPLYPFWEVRKGGETAYVDQQRNVWRDLRGELRGG